jgi:hypothetical protein
MYRVLAFLFIVKIPSKPHFNLLLVNARSRHISSQRQAATIPASLFLLHFTVSAYFIIEKKTSFTVYL